MMNYKTLMENGNRHGYLFFWHHTETPGTVTKACLSQWYQASFFDGTDFYSCAEQYMMAEKARLMGDSATRQEILQESDPIKIKHLGKKVKNFRQVLWDANKADIIIKGNLMKFGQNLPLRHFLLSTGDSILVEASPYDTIWGIGLEESHPDARNPYKWKGQNLLGFALMEVRDRLKKEQEKRPVCCCVTPENITTLKPNEVFVFGSNLAGQHMRGAARAAVLHFGAKMGVGVGMQGQAYAIPTMQGGIVTIRPYVDQFIEYAAGNTDRHFLVTKIGCGIAGFKCEDIAPLFAEAIHMANISLPQEFIEIIHPKKQAPTADEMKVLKKWKHGLGHMGKAFNGEDPMPSKEKIATKSSWKTKPMPDEHVTITLGFTIPTKAMEIVKRGHIPEAMEDHWFMYCDAKTIRYFRSWTGICIYTARYEVKGDKTVITTLRINRNKEQYGQTDNKKDAYLFLALLTGEFGGDASKFWDLALS